MSTKFDFSRCLIDFTKCPKGVKLINHFGELAAFSEFTSVKDEKIIKLAIATADMESPALKIKDRETMIKSLFAFLEINMEGRDGKKLYDDIVNYKDSRYLNCFGRYLMILHDIDWTEYQSTKQTHDVLTMDSVRPREEGESIDAFVKRRVSIQSHLKKLGNDLKVLEGKIYPDSRAAREVALNEAKKIITHAERHAQLNTFI